MTLRAGPAHSNSLPLNHTTPGQAPASPTRALTRRVMSIALGTLMLGGMLTAGAATANANTVVNFDNAALEWGLNEQHQLGSQFGGCDFFSAGASDGSANQYRTQEGNLHIIKRAADGTATAASKATRCTPASPTVSQENGQRLLFSKGVGTTDTATGVTEIQWTGTASINSYGGLVPWNIFDPKLVVAADGTGQLLAGVGGYGSSMDDPSQKFPLNRQNNITLAQFSNVTVGESGITATPTFGGIDYYPIEQGVRSSVSAITPQIKIQRPGWGSWPENFVDFQYLTGLSTYWHTSGLTADEKKPPLPVTVTFDSGVPVMPAAIVQHPVSATVSSGASASFSTEVSGYPVPSIAWQTKTPSGEWTTVEGATEKTFTLTNVTTAEHNGLSIRALAHNEAGDASSTEAKLTVDTASDIVITKQPTSVTGKAGGIFRLSVTVTGSSPQYQWQRSTDSGATWANWGTNTATTSNLASASATNSGDQYRVLVSNGVSDPVISDVATLTLTTQAPVITANAIDAIGFEGGKVLLRAYGNGAPDPTWTWETSADHGATWTTYPSSGSTLLYVETLTNEMNGNLFRVRGTNGVGEDAVSEARKVTVLPALERGSIFTSNGNLTPETTNVLSVSGAGYTVPDSYTGFMRIGFMEEERWNPASPNKDNFVGESGTIYAATLKRDAGAYARTLTMPAGAFDPGKKYVFVTFSSVAGDDALTSAAPAVLAGDILTGTAAPHDVADPSVNSRISATDLGLSTARAGDTVRIANLEPYAWFHATVFSEPTALGWFKTNAEGSFEVTLPADLSAETHSVVLQNPAGLFRAWQPVAIEAVDVEVPPTTPGTTPGSGGTGGTGSTGGTGNGGTGNGSSSGGTGTGTGTGNGSGGAGSPGSGASDTAATTPAARLAVTGIGEAEGLLLAASAIALLALGTALTLRRGHGTRPRPHPRTHPH